MKFSILSDSTLLGKLARYPLRMLPRTMTVPILQGALKGKRWIVGSQRHAFWLGNYEPFLQKRMAQEVERGGVFYDVGANVGFYSLLASSLIDPGKVFAFEPWPLNIQFLMNHLKLNGVRNVKAFEIAISDQVGTAFFQGEETGAMGHLQTTGSFQVATSTIDSLIYEQSVAPPDCIKMDIEGGEYKALMGAKECFRKYKPKLFLATHGCAIHDECCRILRAWGYELEFLSVEDNNNRADIFAKCGP
jgi:FkbM family methyltransferase